MEELRSFIRKSQTRQLYRQFLRLVKLAPPSDQKELKDSIKLEFKKHLSETRDGHIAFLLAQGRKRLLELENLLKMSK
ncbi:hypothetical protein GAYE_PCTG30G0728 [Galdieria yellowstonensis]|uniref:Complex 1 LYR protein domain-containing protein n=1 Tax=Galdieria yellowstonensis TaxID=3028027 RepID=A0AAV9I5X0_9RHOD|nr:hypothetical protein GAYE_PCTG30G0728 [Galdieria yellowstonensis]